MGFDAFWPTSIATVHVACVPAAPVSPSRFDEIIRCLAEIHEIRTADLDLPNDFNHDFVFTPSFKDGSILFNFAVGSINSKSSHVPLDISGSPQVVLGIVDTTHSTAARHHSLEQAHDDLKSRYQRSPSDPVCKVICCGSQGTTSSRSILFLPDLADGTVRGLFRDIAVSVIESNRLLSTELAEKDLDDSVVKATLPRQSNGDRSLRDASSVGQTAIPQTPAGDAPSTPTQLDSTRKGRYTVTIGVLNLQVGSWLDALRRLGEGAAICQEGGDSLWQAKAIEGILVSMLLLAWKDVEFEVPNVCQRAYRTSQLMSRLPSFNISPALAKPSIDGDDSHLEPLRKFFKYGSAVVQATFDLYTSLASRPHPNTPSIMLIQARIRLLNLLILFRRHGRIKQASDLSSFVLGNRQEMLLAPGEGAFSGQQISSSILELLPLPDDLAGSEDAISTVTAALTSLSLNGSSRRHALILSQFLKQLALVLNRARQLGASESGVHLSVSTSSSNTTSSNEPAFSRDGFRSLLQAAAQVCGLYVDFTQSTNGNESNDMPVATHLQSWFKVWQDGDMLLKLEILKHCIDVADSLPDIEASMVLSSILLRTAIRTPTISTLGDQIKPVLPPEEQSTIIDGLRKNASAANRLNATDILPEYWDDFLVRDVQVYQPPTAAKLTSHTPNDLSAVSGQSASSSRDPFIFNPFAKGVSSESTPVVVAEELITFSVVLQNPLEVEVEVDDISLIAEGSDFEASHHSIVLGAFCSQTFSLTGRAKASGSLKVRGCRASIAGCRKINFDTFKQIWQPPHRGKFKSFHRGDPVSGHSSHLSSLEEVNLQIPKSSALTIKVIDPQSRLEIIASNLTKPSLMLLDGETRTFELTLKNQSTMVNDFLLFSYSDNVTTGLSEALGRKDLTMSETYEIQHQLTSRRTLKAQDETNGEASRLINPGDATTHAFDVYGRPGLLDVAVQIDFAYLGVPKSELKQTFHTRHTSFPIAVTVNGTIDITRCNVLPIGDGFLWPLSSQTTSSADMGEGELKHHNTMTFARHEYCTVALDLRNVWPQPLIAELRTQMKMGKSADQRATEDYTIQETLQPGQVTRFVLLVPRLFIQDPYAAIPNLIAQRQFVISASKLSMEAEATSREIFWYREELLKHISGSWKEEKTGRHGEIDLRKGVRLNSRMIDALKIEHVDISFWIKPDLGAATTESIETVQQLSRGHFSVTTESFATVVVRIQNRSKDRLALLLRLQPSLRDQPHNIALDLSRRFAWSGVLQQALYPAIEPGDVREAELGITPLAQGNYEINATVEEIRGRTKTKVPVSSDGVGLSGERRIWHARSPCLIDVVDSPS